MFQFTESSRGKVELSNQHSKIYIFPLIRSRMRSHRRDLTMSVLLITIVMVFILCNTVRVMCNVYEATQVLT